MSVCIYVICEKITECTHVNAKQYVLCVTQWLIKEFESQSQSEYKSRTEKKENCTFSKGPVQRWKYMIVRNWESLMSGNGVIKVCICHLEHLSAQLHKCPTVWNSKDKRSAGGIQQPCHTTALPFPLCGHNNVCKYIQCIHRLNTFLQLFSAKLSSKWYQQHYFSVMQVHGNLPSEQ